MQNLEAANTRSSVSLWGRSYLDNKTLLWSFGPDRVSLVPPKEDAYRFAPYKTNGSKYPLYAKVEMKDKKNNSLFANNKLQSDIYVAVSCIHALGKKEPDIHHPPTQEIDWPSREKELIDSYEAVWGTTLTDQPPAIPVRDESGCVRLEKLHTSYSTTWKDLAKDLFGNSHKSKNGKPVRHVELHLTKPLLIEYLGSHNQLISTRFGSVNKFFEEILKDAQGLAQGDWEFARYESCGLSERENYIPISQDPFGIYRTWIHSIHWNEYMKGLQPDNNTASVRRFIPITDPIIGLLDKAMFAIGDSNKEAQAKLRSEHLAKLKRSASFYELDEDERPKKKNRAKSEKKMDKQVQGLVSMKINGHFSNGTTEIGILLDPRKMEAAVGKRPGEASQKAVMGNVSATEIGSKLGWETRRLKSGNYAAEWLHLSAFSWGGLEEVGEKYGHSTSQTAGNLVFGTSEANSLMTRYEMAWQKLFSIENKLYTELCKYLEEEMPELAGELWITCNEFTEKIEYDKCDAKGKYTTGTFEASKSEMEKLKSTDLLTMAYNKEPDDSLPVQQVDGDNNAPTRKQILALAHDFNFIAYSIQYEVRADFHSWLFNLSGLTNTLTFFPLRRPLFHRAEADLDEIILKKFYGKAIVEIKEIVQRLIQTKNEKELDQILADRKYKIYKDAKTRKLHVLYGDRKAKILGEIDKKLEELGKQGMFFK